MSYQSPSASGRRASSAVVVAFIVACSRGDAAGSAAKTTSVASAATATSQPTAAQDSIAAKADRGRILGDSTAQVWLVMASDFQCPFCKQWHDAQFANIEQKYVKSGRVRVAYLNMPLNIHPFAVPAAEAAMCAAVQDKFWPMHDSLFATQRIWEVLQSPASFFDTLAHHNHVDMDPWRTCVSKHLALPTIQADYERARKIGATQTPTFFIGATKLESADADVAGALDAALAAKAKR